MHISLLLENCNFRSGENRQFRTLTFSCCAVRRFSTTYPISSRLPGPALASVELTITFTADRCNLCWWRALLTTGHASSCVKFGFSTCATGSVIIIWPSNFASTVSILSAAFRRGNLHPKQWNITMNSFHQKWWQLKFITHPYMHEIPCTLCMWSPLFPRKLSVTYT